MKPRGSWFVWFALTQCHNYFLIDRYTPDALSRWFGDPKLSFRELLVSKITGSQAKVWSVMFVLISEKNSVAKEGCATRNWKMQLNLQEESKPQDNGFRNCFLTLQGISYSRCHYHYFTTFFGFSSSLKLFNYIFVCIWDRYSGSFPRIYFLLSFP